MPIRFAGADDSGALLAIYAQYIDTPVTFEYALPSPQAFEKRIAEIAAVYPCLVYEEAGRICGYAYAHRHRERPAYQWNAELSIYIDRACVANGIGKRLYAALIGLLRLQGVKTAYAGVTVPNAASEALHLSLGFMRIGVYHNTGYKCGAWRDTCWFEKAVAPYAPDPLPIVPIGLVPKEAAAAVLGGTADR